MKSAVMLSKEEISGASAEFKLELSSLLGLVPAPEVEPAEEDGYEGYEQIEMNTQAARAFVQGCGAKTLSVLKAVLQLGNPFSLRQLEAQFGVPENGLRSVWSGLTKRSKTISGNPMSYLVKFELNEEAASEDYWGRLSEVTFAALSKVID